MATRAERWVGRLGFAAGLTIAALALASMQAPRAAEVSRVRLDLHVNQTGELGVTPSGKVLRARGLAPGRPVRTAVSLRNLTGRTLAVRLRAASASRDLDDVLWVRLAGGRRELYAGPLRGLRRWTAARLVLPARAERKLRATFSIPARAPGGLVGPADPLTLELGA